MDIVTYALAKKMASSVASGITEVKTDGKVVAGRITVPRGNAKAASQVLNNADDYIITISPIRVVSGDLISADNYQLYDPLVLQGYGNSFFVQLYLKPGVTDSHVTDKDTLTYNWIAVKKAN